MSIEEGYPKPTLERRPPKPNVRRPAWVMTLIYAGVVLAGIYVFNAWSQQASEIKYNRFKTLVSEGRVKDAAITGATIEGHYMRAGKEVFFVTTRLDNPPDDKLIEDLQAKGV